MAKYSGFTTTDLNAPVEYLRDVVQPRDKLKRKEKSVSTTPTRQQLLAAPTPTKTPPKVPGVPDTKRTPPQDTSYIRNLANDALWKGDFSTAMQLDANADQIDSQRGMYLYQQGAAGAVLPFANAAPEGKGYLPALVPMVPALVNDIGQLFSKNSTDTTQEPNILQMSSDAFQRANDRNNEFFQVENPNDPAELAANFVGGMIIPAKVPKFKGAGPVTNVLAGVGNVAVETLLPFRQQDFFSPTTAIGGALSLGIMEGVDAAFNTEYNSFVDQAQALIPQATVSPHASVVPKEQPMEAIQVSDPNVDINSPDYNGPINQEVGTSEVDINSPDYMGTPEQGVPKQEEKVPIWRDPAYITGGLALLGLAGFGVFNYNSVKSKLHANRINDPISGITEAPQITPLKDQILGAYVQGDQAIRSAAKKYILPNDKKAVQNFNAELDGVTAPAINSKINRAFLTGDLPNSRHTIFSPARFLEAASTELDDAQKAKLNAAVLAGTALDDVKANGQVPSFATAADGFTPLTAMELQRIYFEGVNDPLVKKYMDINRRIQDGLLKYRLERGEISPAQYQEMLANRPNYIHMSRNVVGGPQGSGDSAHLNVISKRNTEDLSGISAGEAVNFMRDYPAVIASTIRKVEVNAAKRKFITQAVRSPALKKVIKIIPAGSRPDDMTGVHDIIINGVQRFVKISDKALDTALKFSPATINFTGYNVLTAPAKFAKNFITGAGNPAFGIKAMAYDTVMGIATRPKEIDLGILSDVINAIGNPTILKPLKYLDSYGTAWLSAPVGAMRLAVDELIGNAGHSLAIRLLKDNDDLVNLIGKQNAKTFADWVTHVYDKTISVKADMDRTGAFSSGNFANTGTDTVTVATADMAPNYFYEMARQNGAEALQSATLNEFSKAAKVNNIALTGARANALSRAYLGLTKLMHEGFRYQVYAGNRTKVARGSMEETLLASQVRRISADVLQRGNGDLAKAIDDNFIYANAAVQGPVHLARRFMDNPVETASSVSITLSMMAFATYAYLANSDEGMAKWNAMTDEQKMRSIPTPAGLVAVPGELRVPWGLTTGILDEMTGVNKGEFDPEWVKGFNAYLDGSVEFSDIGEYSTKERVKAGLWGLSPITPGSSPVVNAIAAGVFGKDLGFSKFGDSGVKDITTQQISGLDADKSLIGDAVSANMMKAISSITGSVGTDVIRSGMDYFRTMDHSQDTEKAWEVFKDSMLSKTARSDDPLMNALFPDAVRKESYGTADVTQYYAKTKGMTAIANAFRKDIENPYQTGSVDSQSLPRDIDFIPPELGGTKLAIVGNFTKDLLSNLRPYATQERELQDQVENIQNGYTMSQAEKNAKINDYNDQRQGLIKLQNSIIRDYEDMIGEQIGDPSFSFQSAKPDDLLDPIP